MNEMQLEYMEAYEIAEALIKNEVTIQELISMTAFASKASITEDAVWEYCERNRSFQRYKDIYPNGRHRNEIEELIWRCAVETNTIQDFISYREQFPQGVHISEVDDKVWEIVKVNGTWPAYLNFFHDGKHADEAREKQAKQREEEEARAAAESEEEEAWKVAKNYDTVASYQGYMDAYPNGKYAKEAQSKKYELSVKEKENIIRNLEEDRNAYSLAYIKSYGISSNDLRGRIRDSKGQVRDEVLRSWEIIPKILNMGETPESIPEGCTEVYFWGVPGSGKTCAMAAILSCARKKKHFAPRPGKGLAYMNDLSSMFTPEPGIPAVYLPAGSDVDTTQYLPLTLNEKIENRKGSKVISHNLSVIEISGEIFECFSCELENRPYKSIEHRTTYEQLKKYLKSNDNPKYHFFILDSKPTQNADQMRHLQNAALFFQTEGVFNATTQGISLIVTKSDILSPNRNDWVRCAEEAAEEYFGSLVTQLKAIVGNPDDGGLGISDGTLPVIPLSIGEVFFQKLCLFDPEPATVLVDLLIEYSKVAEGTDWKKKLKKTLKK